MQRKWEEAQLCHRNWTISFRKRRNSNVKRRVQEMNSCDLNLDLFTEEVLDLIISRCTNYSI